MVRELNKYQFLSLLPLLRSVSLSLPFVFLRIKGILFTRFSPQVSQRIWRKKRKTSNPRQILWPISTSHKYTGPKFMYVSDRFCINRHSFSFELMRIDHLRHGWHETQSFLFTGTNFNFILNGMVGRVILCNEPPLSPRKPKGRSIKTPVVHRPLIWMVISVVVYGCFIPHVISVKCSWLLLADRNGQLFCSL